MSHTPWTREDAEKWAHDMAIEKGWGSNAHEKHKIFESGFLAGLTKAAEVIEAAPSVYCSKPDECNSHLWSNFMTKGYDTHSAKLVGVREIADSEESGSGR